MSAALVAQIEAAFVVGVHGDDAAKRVLLALAHYADDDGRVTVTDNGEAREMRIAVPVLNRAARRAMGKRRRA